MTRHYVWLLTAGFVLAMVTPMTAVSAPNILLIIGDDMGVETLASYGLGENPPATPHLDEMVANGLRLDRFYAGAPNCSPTRASVLTGRSNDRAGVRNHGYPLRLQEKTWPQPGQKAG